MKKQRQTVRTSTTVLRRHNRKALALCLVATLALGPWAAGQAAPTVYEGFAGYTAGTDLIGQDGGSGWGGPWEGFGSGPMANATRPGLAFGDLAQADGAARTGPPDPSAGVVYWRGLPEPIADSGDPLYLSVLLQPQTGFGSYGGINLGDLFVGMSGSNNNRYALEGPNVGQIDSSDIGAVAGETVLLVIEALLLTGPDQVSLFVNPTPGEPLPGVADAIKTNLNLSGTDTVQINNGGAWTTDEIRLGATAADVLPVPVPSTLGLMTLGLLSAIRLRRRRRRR
jgi:hypothetical protein